MIGIADSGIDDDRLAPRQAPLLHLSAGGKQTPHDPVGHGTAVASLLVANRPDVGVVGIVPDATLLSARIVKSASCTAPMLEHGLLAAFGWLRRQGAQVVNVSANGCGLAVRCVESLRALQLSGALVVAAAGNGGIKPDGTFPASQPGVLAVGALAPGSSTQVVERVVARLVRRPRGAGRGDQGHGDERARPIGQHRDDTHVQGHLVLGAARDRRGGDGLGDAPRLDGRRGRECARAQRHAAREGRPEPQLGLRPAGREPRAAHPAELADSHEPNDWVAAALAQRPLRPGAVVVASLGWADDTVDAYTVDVPAGTTARAALAAGCAGHRDAACCRSTRPTAS